MLYTVHSTELRHIAFKQHLAKEELKSLFLLLSGFGEEFLILGNELKVVCALFYPSLNAEKKTFSIMFIKKRYQTTVKKGMGECYESFAQKSYCHFTNSLGDNLDRQVKF